MKSLIVLMIISSSSVWSQSDNQMWLGLPDRCLEFPVASARGFAQAYGETKNKKCHVEKSFQDPEGTGKMYIIECSDEGLVIFDDEDACLRAIHNFQRHNS